MASVTVITGRDVGGGFVLVAGDILAWSFFLNMGVVWSLVEHPKYLFGVTHTHNKKIPFELVWNVSRVPRRKHRRGGTGVKRQGQEMCRRAGQRVEERVGGCGWLTQKPQVHQ